LASLNGPNHARIEAKTADFLGKTVARRAKQLLLCMGRQRRPGASCQGGPEDDPAAQDNHAFAFFAAAPVSNPGECFRKPTTSSATDLTGSATRADVLRLPSPAVTGSVAAPPLRAPWRWLEKGPIGCPDPPASGQELWEGDGSHGFGVP
jgi:hypothetical protein